MTHTLHAAALALALIAAPVLAPSFALSQIALPPAPEPATGRVAKPAVMAQRQMVVTAHPDATEAGIAMLRAGGSAIDAAIAAQAVLGLVEPQSSGIGGGAFLLLWDPATRRLESWDGRETAPRTADEALFLDPEGAPMSFWDAVVGGRSVGTPGVLAMLQAVHARDGRIAWEDLFQPAIALAERGFPVSPRLASLLARDEYLATRPQAAAYFLDPDGKPWREGHVLRNPDYAETLRRIAREGAAAFYRGPLAEAIVQAVRTDPVNPGRLSMEDLAAYRPIQRPAVCVPYRGHSVCGMGPPSSGGLTVGMILGMLERFDLTAGPMDRATRHLVAEAQRQAFADRNRWMADADFFPVPLGGLIDPGYLAGRAALIDPARAVEDALPGSPPGAAPPPRDASTPEAPSTTHLSIVDGRGLAVSMTSSIEGAFGSRLFVGGFLLNNQLTDFAFQARQGNTTAANRVEPGKRPRSSMAPTLIFAPDGSLSYVLGSPGGSRIIGFVAQSTVALIDWGMSPAQAAALGHVLNRDGPTELEAGTEAERLAPGLAARGHSLCAVEMTSGLHIIARRADGRLEAGIDPRREGSALGD